MTQYISGNWPVPSTRIISFHGYCRRAKLMSWLQLSLKLKLIWWFPCVSLKFQCVLVLQTLATSQFSSLTTSPMLKSQQHCPAKSWPLPGVGRCLQRAPWQNPPPPNGSNGIASNWSLISIYILTSERLNLHGDDDEPVDLGTWKDM